MNGLYDAKEDHVPLLAIIGQFGTTGMNMDTFQEMNEDPIYADVSVYHRVVMTAQSLPHIIDEAIRQAYSKRGVAVVQLPVDLGWQEIEKIHGLMQVKLISNRNLLNPNKRLLSKRCKFYKMLNVLSFSLVSGCVAQGLNLWSFQEKLKPQ